MDKYEMRIKQLTFSEAVQAVIDSNCLSCNFTSKERRAMDEKLRALVKELNASPLAGKGRDL